jgi:hypothetical protein
MQFKNFTIAELKENYSERHGFVFAGSVPSDPYYCDAVSYAIKQNGGADVDVEFVVPLTDKAFAFVYPEDTHFKSGQFFMHCLGLSKIMDFQIDMLRNFLNNN